MPAKRGCTIKIRQARLAPKSRQPWMTGGFALTPYDAGLGKQGLGLSNQQGHRPRGLEGPPRSDYESIRPRAVARYAPSVAVPQPSINKSQAHAANAARSAVNHSADCPKNFASAWRNCPAHVEETAQ